MVVVVGDIVKVRDLKAQTNRPSYCKSLLDGPATSEHMSALLPFKFPASEKYDAILDSFVTTTPRRHVRAVKALFDFIMYKVYCERQSHETQVALVTTLLAYRSFVQCSFIECSQSIPNGALIPGRLFFGSSGSASLSKYGMPKIDVNQTKGKRGRRPEKVNHS